MPTLDDQPADLTSLRRELDRLDDALHDLLMQRAAIAKRVAATKRGVALRPGREAAIIRRLLANHAGPFPAASLVRVWRELIGGMTALQGPYRIAVCEAAKPRAGVDAAAREHFGFLSPLITSATPANALAAVGEGLATAAVLPLPTDGGSWWPLLLQAEPHLYICARLPFWADRPQGVPDRGALVVSLVPPDPSGDDRSLLALDAPEGDPAASATAAGFDPGTIIRHDGTTLALVDVAGFVTADDPRLSRLPATLLGAYAVPIGAPPP